MRLSIFNFRTVLSIVYLSLAFVFLRLMRAHNLQPFRLPPYHMSTYNFSKSITSCKPDLILIGNSLLYANIDVPLLDDLLSKTLHRRFRTLILAEGGAQSPWWYLVLKNNVISSRHGRTAVGIFFRGHDLTDYNRNMNERQRWAISKLLKDENDGFFKKAGMQNPRNVALSQYQSERLGISQYLLYTWTNALLFWGPVRRDARPLLENRFGWEWIRPQDPMRTSQITEAVKESSCLNIKECGEKTLLPDMIRIAQGLPLFFVEVHPRPGDRPDPKMSEYRNELTKYLKRNGVTLVSLANKPQLDDLALFGQTEHLTEQGRIINTHLFADALCTTTLNSVYQKKIASSKGQRTHIFL